MKKTIIFYPFLFAIYPILGLYSRNLTEIQPWELVRPLFFALIATTLFFLVLSRLFKDRERAAFLAAFLIFFYSASELVYRVLEGYLIPGLNESFHRVLLLTVTLMLILLGSRAVWDKYMTAPRRKLMLQYLNAVSLLIIFFPLFNIASFWMTAWDDALLPWSGYIGQNEPAQPLSTDSRPDIYYIILDGYSRSDIQQQLYGFDNSSFLDELKQRGFFIGEESQSNYLRTSLSITSALNMEYINFTEDLAGPKSINRIPLFELASNNRARRLLEDAGYKFVLVDSGSAFTRFYDADVFVTPFRTRPNLFEMWFYSTTALNALYEPELPFTRTLQDVLPVAGFSTHRIFVTEALYQLASMPQIESPKFVFAHVIAPHPPFVLGPKGEPLHPPYPYVASDGASFAADINTYQKGYLDQVTYLNGQVLKTIDNILANSTQPPVIVIQGDHGPGLLLNLYGDVPQTCMWERASILNAYYFPQEKTGRLYSSISPINSFRVIFNTYFETSFEILPDRTFYSLFKMPYDFIDISDTVRENCGTTPRSE